MTGVRNYYYLQRGMASNSKQGCHKSCVRVLHDCPDSEIRAQSGPPIWLHNPRFGSGLLHGLLFGSGLLHSSFFGSGIHAPRLGSRFLSVPGFGSGLCVYTFGPGFIFFR